MAFVWWLIHIHGAALVKGIAHLTSPHHWFWHANGCGACGAHGTCGRCSCGTWWCLWYLRLLCLWYCYWRHWELTVRPLIKGVGWRRLADAGPFLRLGPAAVCTLRLAQLREGAVFTHRLRGFAESARLGVVVSLFRRCSYCRLPFLWSQWSAGQIMHIFLLRRLMCDHAKLLLS